MKYAIAGVVLLGALAAASGPTSPLKVSGSVGHFGTVEGVVSEVHVASRSGVTFIDMGGHYPDNTFTAVIWPEDAGKFPNVEALDGKTVKITGPLRLYQGREEIILKDPEQLTAE